MDTWQSPSQRSLTHHLGAFAIAGPEDPENCSFLPSGSHWLPGFGSLALDRDACKLPVYSSGFCVEALLKTCKVVAPSNTVRVRLQRLLLRLQVGRIFQRRMGAYLSQPVTTKDTFSGQGKATTYGGASMQVKHHWIRCSCTSTALSPGPGFEPEGCLGAGGKQSG